MDKMRSNKRKCGECHNFHFNWEKYWCSAGETYVIPTAENPSMLALLHNKDLCDKYIKGYGHNHEF